MTPTQFLLAPPVRFRATVLLADDADIAGVCMVCKDPLNTTEGCIAIRLTHCNHVIGLECFMEWINRMPNTCTHWNHHIPYVSLSHAPGWNQKSLTWICATRIFLAIDSHVSAKVIQFDEAVVVRKESTIWEHSKLWLKHIVATIIRLWPIMGISPIAVVIAVLVLDWFGFGSMNTRNFPSTLSVPGIVIRLAMFSVASSSPWLRLAISYLVIVGCVFSLAWWKNKGLGGAAIPSNAH